MRRAGLLLGPLLAFLLSTAGPARAADPPITVENIRVGFNNNYKLGVWVPVSVDLKAGAKRFEGTLEVVVPDDDGTATSVFRVVDVPARETLSYTTYVRCGTRDVEFRARVHQGGPDGRLMANAVGQQMYNRVETGQRLILTLGNPRGVDEVPKLPGFTDENRQNWSRVLVTTPRPETLPAAWYGYDAADIIVIDTNSREVMSALSTRGEGLREWVRNGGHVVIAVGGNWQQVVDGPLRPLLPATPVGRENLKDLGAIEAFAGAENKPLTKEGDPPVQVTKFELISERGAKGLDATATGPVLVRGHYGFGRVTLVGLDVDSRPFADWALKNQFWARVFELRAADLISGAPTGANYMQQNVSDLATLLHSNLEAFQGVKLVPFGLVAFFVFLYILVIGPGDYFFLKKVVKRMELTWITFPLVVVVVSLIAYVAAYAIKGTDLKINKVDAVDLDQVDGLLRGSTWFTIFSPQNRDYDIALVPQQLDQPTSSAAGSPGEPATTSMETTDQLLSWFGKPENEFGGTAGSGRMGGMGGSGYIYGSVNRKDGEFNPFGEPEVVRGARVPIWSTKSVQGRWFANSKMVAVEADLHSGGADRLAGTVTNRLAVPMRDAFLVYGKYVYLLGDIAPGEAKSLATGSDRTLAGEIDKRATALPRSQQWNYSAQPVELSRTDLIRTMMFASSTSGREGYTASQLFLTLDMTSHLALDRPMLVANLGDTGASKAPNPTAPANPRTTEPRKEVAAAKIDLGKLSAPPIIEQTTVLRVILAPPAAR